MKLELILEQTQVNLSLLNDGKIIASEIFSYYHDLDDKLITRLDRLLKRNKIDVSSLKSYNILGGLGSEATSHKIAEAFIAGLKV